MTLVTQTNTGTMVKFVPKKKWLAHRWLLLKGKHLFVNLFVSWVLLAFAFVIKSLLACP